MINNILWQIHNMLLGLFRKTTIGVSALVVYKDKILLITHTYVPNWYGIGGGVDKGENPRDAIERELFEEVGIKCITKPQLFNVYHNNISRPDDYVILYIVKDFERIEVASPEILKSEWFQLDKLPDDISPGTKRRIEEYLGTREYNGKW